MPITSKRSAAAVPLAICPEAMSKASGAGSRTYISSSPSSSRPMPAASWRTTEPQPMLSTPGCSSIGISSIGLPKPITSNITVALS